MRDLSSFWKQAAEFYLREGNPQAAVKCLQHLLSLNPDDKKTLAKLVIAYVNVSTIKLRFSFKNKSIKRIEIILPLEWLCKITFINNLLKIK